MVRNAGRRYHYKGAATVFGHILTRFDNLFYSVLQILVAYRQFAYVKPFVRASAEIKKQGLKLILIYYCGNHHKKHNKNLVQGQRNAEIPFGVELQQHDVEGVDNQKNYQQFEIFAFNKKARI
jgi:hypothetical protein